MLGKSGENSHSSTVIVDGNSAQISLHRFTQISTNIGVTGSSLKNIYKDNLNICTGTQTTITLFFACFRSKKMWKIAVRKVPENFKESVIREVPCQ